MAKDKIEDESGRSNLKEKIKNLKEEAKQEEDEDEKIKKENRIQALKREVAKKESISETFLPDTY